jgi:hypothetical protein
MKKAELLAQAEKAEKTAAEFHDREFKSCWLVIAEFYRDLARLSELKERETPQAEPD